MLLRCTPFAAFRRQQIQTDPVLFLLTCLCGRWREKNLSLLRFLWSLLCPFAFSTKDVANFELAAASGDGPGPFNPSAAKRPFPSFGVLTTVLEPTLTFPKQDNERDVDVSVWEEVRRWKSKCEKRSAWTQKEPKACFRGAIRHSAFCNGYTFSGSPDRSGKVTSNNWKVRETRRYPSYLHPKGTRKKWTSSRIDPSSLLSSPLLLRPL